MTTGTETREPGAARASDRLREQVGTVGEDLKTLGGLARDVAREKLGEARTTATEAYAEGRRRAEHGLDDLSRRIQEKPIQAIAIAAGIGALLGALLARRR